MPFSKHDLTLIATSIGFVSAVFLSLSSISMGAKEICLQATPYWDFSEPIAHALMDQMAYGIVGSFFLMLAFFLQIVAHEVPSTTASKLPQQLRTWFCLIPTVCFLFFIMGSLGATVLKAITTKNVRELNKYPKSLTSPQDRVCEQ